MLKKIKLLIGCLLLCLISFPSTVKADELSDALTTKLITNIVGNEDFSFKVKQHIEVNLDGNHGIFVTIPYDKNSNVIEDIEVEGYTPYEVSNKSENNHFYKVVKIGDKDDVLYGKHEYDISYTIKGSKRASEKDFVALVMIPAYWNTPIEYAKTTLKMPKPLKWKNLKMYVGSANSNNNLVDDSHFTYKKSDTSLVISAKNLPEKYGASIYADVDEGYWQNVGNTFSVPFGVLMFLLGCLIITIVLWFIFGRDKKVVEVVEFYPPEGLTPSEISYYINRSVDKKDIVPMFLYFASKGYVKIKEVEKKNIRIIKVKDIDRKKEPLFAIRLFDMMFDSTEEFNPKEIDESFAQNINDLEIDIIESVEKNGAIENPISKFISYLITALAVIFTGLVFLLAYFKIDFSYIVAICILGAINLLSSINSIKKAISAYEVQHKVVFKECWMFLVNVLVNGAVFGILGYLYFGYILSSIGCGLVIMIIIFVAIAIRCRNSQTDMIYGRILGFRRFIETAELDRLKMLVDENPEYFFDILPYAQVFKLTDKWMDKLKMIEIDDLSYPIWLDLISYHDMMYVADCLNDIVYDADRAIDDTIHEMSKDIVDSDFSSSFDSDDFFSGDGFGAGGGGVW